MKQLVIFFVPCFFLLLGNSTKAQDFNYGTGDITSVPNQAPFNTGGGTGITISGNDVTVTGNVSMSGGIYDFHNFTINAGTTVTDTGSSPVIIRCTGTATINGTINAIGGNGAVGTYSKSGAGGATNNGGGAPGGNGGNTIGGSGVNGTGFGSFSGGGEGGIGIFNILINDTAGGGGGGGYGTVGTDALGASGSYGFGGSSYGDAGLTTIENGTNLLGGSGGGGGGGSRATSAGSGGGGGGGAISITAKGMSIGDTGLITVKGGNGGNGDGNGGAGGGGAGGTVLLQYISLTYTPGGTLPVNADASVTAITGIDYSGGQGGAINPGGNGGTGRYLAIQDSVATGIPTASAIGDFIIYPNPFSNNIFIDPSTEPRVTGIEIYNVLGKMLMKKIMPTHQGIIQLDCINLTNGVYELRVKTETADYIQKLIKLK